MPKRVGTAYSEMKWKGEGFHKYNDETFA